MKIPVFTLIAAVTLTFASANAKAQQVLSVAYSNSASAIPANYNLFALAQASSPQFSSGTVIGDPSSGTQSYSWVSGQSINIRLTGANPNGNTQSFFYQPDSATMFPTASLFNTIAIVLRSSTPSVSLTLSNIGAGVAFGPTAQVNNLSVTGPSTGTAIQVATITGFNKGDLDQISGTLTFVGSQASGFDMTIYGYNVPEPSTYSVLGGATVMIMAWAVGKRRHIVQ